MGLRENVAGSRRRF